MKSKKIILALAVSGLVSACSNPLSKTYRTADENVDKNTQQLDKLTQQAAQPMGKADTSQVPVLSGAYLGTSVFKRNSGQALPTSVERGGVRLMSPGAIGLLAIGNLITEATNIPVSFASDIRSSVSKKEPEFTKLNESISSGDPKDVDKLAAALDSVLPKNKAGENSRNHTVPLTIGDSRAFNYDKMRVNYQGTLSGFLNQVAAYFDIGWRYEDGRIQFSRQITRSFSLAVMPSIMDSNATMTAGITESNGSSGGGSSENGGGVTVGATQTSKIEVKLDIWKELQASLKGIVGEQGAFTASPSTGIVTVTAPTSVVERVGRQVYEINRQLLRQVTMKVEVYNVALTKDSNWQFDLEAVYTSGSGTTTIGNALNPALGAGGGISTGVVDGKFKGSKAVLSLLEQKGDVSVVNTASLTTMSGQPVPVQVSNTQNYIESITQSTDDGVTTVTPNVGTVNSGFSLNVLPKVMDDGKVLLQYNMNISTLVGPDNGFNTFIYNGKEQISLPNLDQRSFIQSGLINNGATLVLAGYEKLVNSTSDDGQGSPYFKWLGGKSAATQTREILVVMITPVVLDHAAELVRLN
ncbi:secretin N-terminal domain-containing protein [Aeromonas sp. MdU4]|uniref:secretin N-terminal domain-containing protein n=1 Tax=Aeromonas sp. MdU4 TaxID=3342819 RepID=UPI0035BB17B3